MWSNVRYATRLLKKSPKFAATVVLTLALGIGANAAIFSVVSGVLVRRLPIRDPQNVVVVHDQFPTLNLPRTTVSVLQFRDFSQRTDLFQSTAALKRTDLTLTGQGQALHLQGMEATSQLLSLLGVRPEGVPDAACPGGQCETGSTDCRSGPDQSRRTSSHDFFRGLRCQERITGRYLEDQIGSADRNKEAPAQNCVARQRWLSLRLLAALVQPPPISCRAPLWARRWGWETGSWSRFLPPASGSRRLLDRKSKGSRPDDPLVKE